MTAPATPAPISFAAPDITDAEVDAVTRVLRSGWLTTGQEALDLEQALASYLGAEHVVAVSSCTAAIEIAYASLGLGPGARVAVPTWTFASSALAPHHHGARPILIDVDPDTLNISPDALAPALDEGLDCVIVVHFGGVPVDPEVLRLCRAHGVPVIEDAAHALGASDDRGVVAGGGTIGACLSFYATKNLTSAEGGALVTEDAGLADFARSFRLHGLSKDAWDRYRPGKWAQYDLTAPGIKANLPDVLAALARSQLARFDAMQARRREVSLRYRDCLAELPELRVLPGDPVEGSADHLMVVALGEGIDRGEVQSSLGAAGIGTSVHFQPLHRFGWFEEHSDVGPGGCPVADEMADQVLSLPLSSTLRLEDVERVCNVLSLAVRS